MHIHRAENVKDRPDSAGLDLELAWDGVTLNTSSTLYQLSVTKTSRILCAWNARPVIRAQCSDEENALARCSVFPLHAEANYLTYPL
jgi:hypothetical protein